jgi:hypothetical protein
MPKTFYYLILQPVTLRQASAFHSGIHQGKDWGSGMTIDLFEPVSSNLFGTGGPFKPDGLKNLFSAYGNPYRNQSATNPFATDAPRLYDQQGNYRGKLSANPARLSSLSGLSGLSGPFT